MENIRNIKNKIKSCMSCDEDHCPIIKERLEQHVQSQHSSSRKTVSSQNMKLGKLSGTLSSKSALTMTTSSAQTSTSDLITEELEKKKNQSIYRKGIKGIISEWAKQLPNFSQPSAENLKENIINQLIEKLSTLSREVKEGYYDLKLRIEIDKFMDSLPILPDTPESDLVDLKEILVGKIFDFNENIRDKKGNNESLKKIKDVGANTQQSFKNNLKYTEIENNKGRTPYNSLSYNNETISDLNLQAKYNGQKLVDAQVQQSFSFFKPFHGNIFQKPIYNIDKQQNTDIMENAYKQIISNWLDYVTRKLDKKEKYIITDAVLNRLKPLLNKTYTINHKILLKAEILNCLNDYLITFLSSENYNQINRISDDLAVKLLGAKLNHEEVNSLLSKSILQNSKDKVLAINFESDFDSIVQKIVCETLGCLDISNLIKRNIINIILQNIKVICMRQDYYIEALIFDIIQHYTELTDNCISDIVRSILNQIRTVATSNYLQMYNSLSNYDSYKLCRPSLISVYKSEHEIRGPNNVPCRRKSSDSNFSQPTVEEKMYINNISELIRVWMTTLPTNGCKKVTKKTVEGTINILAQDILDQVKLEQIVPETRVEKEKYLSFFINRWLNRLNRFENISDAQPYIENLIEKLKNIPAPSISQKVNTNHNLDNGKKIITPFMVQTNDKNQKIGNALKSEAILKEFIAKYIEHNCHEDNSITREVFGHILKTELQKLSTPTRKKVYGDINKPIDNILASKRIAKELQYINIISDWFKTLPLESLFNATGNIQRAQYVNDIAKIISDLEENRLNLPPEIDYNRHLKSTISQLIENLPIIKKYSHNTSFLIDDFVAKIVSLRPPVPGCAFANVKDLSLNASNTPLENLSDFVEAYIRENSDEIADDELKLEAWALRLLQEVDNMASENPSALCTSQVYNRLADLSLQGDDISKRFNLELSYAKEISNWLNNLPLQPIVDKSSKDLRIQMISNLAEKMSMRWHLKNIDPNNTQVDVDLVDYIQKWITELPLNRNKEIILSLLIQQLLNRMERVNTGKQPLPLIQQQPQNDISNTCEPPHSCCNRSGRQKLKTLDPGGAIVEAIESWCKNLPIQSESESYNNTLKEEFSTKLYKKIGELNKNPDYFNNNFLYLQNLEEEIDLGLDNLPQNPQLQNTRQKLKKQILDIINKNRNLMKEKAARVEYRQELAKTIEMSLPYPGPLQSKQSPGFNIYKNRLAEIFILENYDHSQDDVKLNYVKKLRYELDKCFPEAQNINSLPQTKEQMFNELYSSLFSVPPPNETSIIEEVEEVKTRCEIESWFETLPIRKATGLEQLFEWDQILSMLAKRLHYMEKYEKNDDHIHKEIRKWLLKLPIVSSQEENINHYANDLEQRLKLTLNNRKCKPGNFKTLQEESITNKNKNKGVLGTSQIAGPSRDGRPWLSPPLTPLAENLQKAIKRPSDLILDIVETWCQQLPLPEDTQQEKDNAKLLKDNLVVKIIMKISELNVNSEIFENDILYDVILDDELENLLSTLPISNELVQNKTVLKNQLKDNLKSIKPLIVEENARYEYKQELKNTVGLVLEQSPNAPPEKVALFITLRDEIVDNFIAYSFCKDDVEGQEVHKTLVHDAVEKYYVEKIRTDNDEMPDPLIKGNQLLCELAKVPTPSAGVILEEIHEIQMKFEISDLFKELSITNDANKLTLKNQVKSTLARRLSDFNKTSFIQNRRKVREDIMKSLKKIQSDIDPQKVEMFIKKLENLENMRILQLPTDTKNNFPISHKSGEKFTKNEYVEDGQWMSLLPATPRVHDPNYHDTIEYKEFRKTLGEESSPHVPGSAFDRSISQSGISYDKFKDAEPASSSVIGKLKQIQSLSHSNNKHRTVIPDQTQSVGTSNGVVLSEGSQPIDNNANRSLETNPRRRDNFGQLQKLESHDIQPKFTQEIDPRSDMKKKMISPQSLNTGSQSQQHIPSQIRKRSYSLIQNQPPQIQISQRSGYTPSDNQNQRFTSSKYQSNYLPTSSQITLQSQDVPSQQNQYSVPSPLQETLLNVPRPCSALSSDLTPPKPQFYSPTPNSSSRCYKNCRRPSITLLKPPEMQCSNNHGMRSTIRPISDDEECSCNNKIKKKQCRGSPVCPMHMRKQCRICNGVNPFYSSAPPYRRYCPY